MKLISWNSRGTGYDQFMCNCKEMLFRERPDVLCLVETKASYGVGKKLARKFHFDSVFEATDDSNLPFSAREDL